MMNSHGADPAILKGLIDAGCEVRDTYSVDETFNNLRNTYTRSDVRNVMLVAEVQAGAIPLLTLLHETGMNRPPTLLYDEEGNNVHFAIMALKLGVQDYILASEPAVQRELRARVLAERTKTMDKASRPPVKAPIAVLPQISLLTSPAYIATSEVEFQWDATLHMIHMHNTHTHLCPAEARIFDLLFTHRDQIVSAEELLAVGVNKTGSDLTESIKLLRPHITRLRNKLNRHAKLAHHVVNVRSNGYMFV